MGMELIGLLIVVDTRDKIVQHLTHPGEHSCAHTREYM